ncbi:MAG: hypothetical protein Q4B70_16275 [Lachnospiraceae bacterium]|nr:hypothetical protein [Lachnospiraceae bacterium]
MKYFCTEPQRKASKSTCYLEFQRGSYDGRAWKSDSLNLHDDVFEATGLSAIFAQAIPQFDHWGITEVTPTQWQKLQQLLLDSGGVEREIIAELTPWVTACFQIEPVFTICGI